MMIESPPLLPAQRTFYYFKYILRKLNYSECEVQ